MTRVQLIMHLWHHRIVRRGSRKNWEVQWRWPYVAETGWLGRRHGERATAEWWDIDSQWHWLYKCLRWTLWAACSRNMNESHDWSIDTGFLTFFLGVGGRYRTMQCCLADGPSMRRDKQEEGREALAVASSKIRTIASWHSWDAVIAQCLVGEVGVYTHNRCCGRCKDFLEKVRRFSIGLLPQFTHLCSCSPQWMDCQAYSDFETSSWVPQVLPQVVIFFWAKGLQHNLFFSSRSLAFTLVIQSDSRVSAELFGGLGMVFSSVVWAAWGSLAAVMDSIHVQSLWCIQQLCWMHPRNAVCILDVDISISGHTIAINDLFIGTGNCPRCDGH